MTFDEWTALSYTTFSEWWDAPQTEERQRAWFAELERFSADQVLAALRVLLRDAPTFAPKLGELINALSERAPAWELAWASVVQALRLIGDGEQAVVGELMASSGAYVAGWVATYGAKRLALEPVHDPVHGGATLHRLRQSYGDSVASAGDRERTALSAERALTGISERGSGEPKRIDAAGSLGLTRKELPAP